MPLSRIIWKERKAAAKQRANGIFSKPNPEIIKKYFTTPITDDGKIIYRAALETAQRMLKYRMGITPEELKTLANTGGGI